jgi:probable phosphoglycerate mutase
MRRARDTAAIIAKVLGLVVGEEADLREVAFGAKEGQPMGPWYEAWLAGAVTPPGAETFEALRTRAAAALNRALERTPPVLVVAHGSIFRALRAEMGLPVTTRTPNGLPLLCEPGNNPGEPWRLTALTGDLSAAT